MSDAITNLEKELLCKLRNQITDMNLTEDDTEDKKLIRWLRARDLKVADAELMLRRSVNWQAQRRKSGVCVRDNIKHEFRVTVSGLDLTGHPVVLIPSGRYDFKGIVDKGIQDELSEHFFSTFDKLFDFVQLKSKNQPTLVRAIGIVNFEGLGWRQCSSFAALNLIIRLVRDFEANFPEVVEAAFVVNAPAIFSIIYKCLSPVFAPRTLSKFRFFGCNEEEWKNCLLEIISPEQLPQKYGGTLSDDVNLLNQPQPDYQLS